MYRNQTLGIEVSYPPSWQVDSQEWVVWINSSSHPEQSINIANVGFEMSKPEDFLEYIDIPVEMTKTLVLDGQPALFMDLQAVPEAGGV